MKNLNTAKYTFLYLIALLSLVFTVIAVGNIVFQLINKYIVDVIHAFRATYSSEALKFAISSLIIAAPVYYYSTIVINRSLFTGDLNKESAVRKWLTYLIIFSCGVVVVGWLIAIVYSVLDGDLTLKFSLKTLTVIAIAAVVGSYYYRDIKKEKVEKVEDMVIKRYFYGTLVLVIGSLIVGVFFVESPKETRLRKLDNITLDRLNIVDNALNNYYIDNKRLPINLSELSGDVKYVRGNEVKEVVSGEIFEYRVIEKDKYKICANFGLSNKNDDLKSGMGYYGEIWEHEAGNECFLKKVNNLAHKQEVLLRGDPVFQKEIIN